MLIYVEKNYVPICDSRYDKILKTRDIFKISTFNFLFYIPSKKSFYFIRKTSFKVCTTLVADFKCLYLQKQISYTYMKMSRYDKILETSGYFKNINIFFFENSVSGLRTD